MIDILKKTFSTLKLDPFLYIPYIMYSLVNAIILRQFFSQQATLNISDLLYVLLHNTFQSCIGITVILMLKHLSKTSISYASVKKAWQHHLKSYIYVSMIVNLPLIAIQYIGLISMSSKNEPNTILTLLLIPVLGYLIIPLSAWTYNAIIQYTLHETPLKQTLKDNFTHFRKSARWFLMMITLNLPQLFVLPLYTSSWILKDTLIAIIQGIVLTLVMTSSYHFYTITQKNIPATEEPSQLIQ